MKRKAKMRVAEIRPPIFSIFFLRKRLLFSIEERK
jgi:hypothetical protein